MKKHFKTISLLIVVLFSLFFNQCEKVDPKGNLTGVVKDGASANIIESADVLLISLNKTAKTNSEGKFEFLDIEPLNYTIEVSKEGYVTKTESGVVVEDGKTTTREISLTPLGPEIDLNTNNIEYSSNEVEKSIKITNNGKSNLTFEITTEKNWIDVTPQSGTVEPSKSIFVNITVSRSGLEFGKHEAKILINNNAGNSLEVNILMIYEAPNQPPIADFTINTLQGTQHEEFKVDASKSTDDKDQPEVLEVQWTWGDGSQTDWSTSKNASHKYSTFGEKTIILKVKDSNGEISEVSKTITVIEAPNEAPIANFTISDDAVGLKSTIFEFNANQSTDDNDDISVMQVRWKWEESLDFTAWIFNKVTQHQYSSEGTKEVTLEVKDTKGEIGTATKTITIVPNLPPQAIFTVSSLNSYTESDIVFDASGVTDDIDNSSALEIRWQWESGGNFTNWSTTKTNTHSYTTKGLKIVTLEVRDSHGATNSDSKEITIEENPNTKPKASYSVTPESGYITTLFSVDASASNDAEDLTNELLVRWKWEDGELFTDWSTQKTAEHKYSSAGEKKITLEVKDKQGLVDSTSKTITIENTPELELGMKYGGGIIFYIDDTKAHGLIVAEADEGFMSWDDANIACSLKKTDGYDDWYLPSLEELTEICQLKKFLSIQGFTTMWGDQFRYWSSTKLNNTQHSIVSMYENDSCPNTPYSNTVKAGVRAIRAF